MFGNDDVACWEEGVVCVLGRRGVVCELWIRCCGGGEVVLMLRG